MSIPSLQELEDQYEYQLEQLKSGEQLATMINMVYFIQLAEELEQARQNDDT